MVKFIGVASGKGGVGKTTTAVNIGLALQSLGREVSLLDADMGLANAQLFLGVTPKLSLSDFLFNDARLEDVQIPCFGGMNLIPGASGDSSLANLPPPSIANLIENLRDQSSDDYMIFDIAAGISHQNTEMLAACDLSLIVMVDEPSSIADAYGVLTGEYDYDAEGNLVATGSMISYRGLFLIDKEGLVRHMLVNDLPLGRNVEEAIRIVDALQFNEENGEVCPANWKKGKDGMTASFDGVADYLSKH